MADLAARPAIAPGSFDVEILPHALFCAKAASDIAVPAAIAPASAATTLSDLRLRFSSNPPPFVNAAFSEGARAQDVSRVRRRTASRRAPSGYCP